LARLEIKIPKRKNITQRREGAKITLRRIKKERFSSKPGAILSMPSLISTGTLILG